MYEDLKIVPLSSLDPQQARQYGAKATNLGELAAIGMAVPSGIAIGRDVLSNFLRENGIDIVALHRTHNLGMVFFESALKEAQEHQARIIEALIEGTFPPNILERLDEALADLHTYPVAVRSSCVVEDAATTSFAGQYDTFLDVSGRDNVIAAIRRCWVSQYDGRVLKYAISRRGLPVLVPSMAVLIQQMLVPEYAGVCFTEGPTPKTRHVSVMECVVGVGEQLVSGSKTPHYFEIDASGLIVNRRTPKGDTSVPPDDTVVSDVAQASRRIAAHFGTPQDVEWAVTEGELYILQARPITVLGGGTRRSTVIRSTRPTTQDSTAPSRFPPQPEAMILLDDLHDWLIEQIDPTLYRGAAFIIESQKQNGSWEVDAYPEWNVVTTALIISLLMDGGVPHISRWITREGHIGGPAIAISWLASQAAANDTWGTDLWDTCQVVLTLLRCGVSHEDSVIARAADRVHKNLLDDTYNTNDQEWFGAGFYAVALRMFSTLEQMENAELCVERLLSLQAASGDFAGTNSASVGARVPSEWHTSQAISALAGVKHLNVQKSVTLAQDWLLSRQQADGSWGSPEGPYKYFKTFFTAYAILSFIDSQQHDHSAVAKACRWLKQRQTAAGNFGDVASSLMAIKALQRFHGPAFSLTMPIPMFMRIQTYLSAAVQLCIQEANK
jgi:Phosphoenolpyruvate synthase/pyruvate phosphate dikinase